LSFGKFKIQIVESATFFVKGQLLLASVDTSIFFYWPSTDGNSYEKEITTYY